MSDFREGVGNRVTEPSVLQAALEALCGGHEDFTPHIKPLPFDWQPRSHLLEGEFLYPLFGAGGPDIDALVEYIYRSLIPYCLPRAEIKRVTEKAWADKDLHALVALGDRARELFVRTRGAAKSGGEAGELVLHLILEALIKAPLLVSKMSLKTNSNMNVHGRDGIHVRYCSRLNALVLHLGESKLHKSLASAVDDAIDSISEYLGDLALRRREIAIINGNMDFAGIDPIIERRLRDMLNPYRSPPPVRHEVHSCFIGFEYPAYSEVATLPPEEVEAAFIDRYRARAAEIQAQIQEKVGVRLKPPTRLQFFVMPFPNIELFRKTFAQKLGVLHD